MALKALKCPNCEANIRVNDEKGYGVCSYCGAQIQISEIVEVHSAEEKEEVKFDKLMEDSQAYLAMKDYFRAEEGFMEMIHQYPGKALAYERLFCAITHNYTLFPIENTERLQRISGKMMAVASQEEKDKYEEICKKINNELSENLLNRIPNEKMMQIAKLREKMRSSLVTTVILIFLCFVIQEPAEKSLVFSFMGIVLCALVAFFGSTAIMSKIKLDDMAEKADIE